MREYNLFVIKNEYYDIYNYNVPMMIYSQKLKPEQNTTFANTYDIL